LRSSRQLLSSLENAYRESFQRAEAAGDEGEMQRLELDFQRDQVFLSVLLDIRTQLSDIGRSVHPGEPEEPSTLETVERLSGLLGRRFR